MIPSLPASPISLGLPHRPPFLFLDWVTALVPGVSGEGTKLFLPSDPLFEGHFPSNPIVPGVLLSEAIAQLSGIVAAAATPERRFYLTAIRSMKFPTPAHPGETILLQSKLTADHGNLLYFEGEAHVAGKIVATGSILLSQTV